MTDKNRKHRLRPFMVSNNPVQTRAPHEPSAAIHIDDTNGGFLNARLSEIERDKIENPATALMIFNTTTQRFEYFDGVDWVPFGSGSSALSINTLLPLIGFPLPKPQVNLDAGRQIAIRTLRISFSQSTDYLGAYNPRIILMRYKQARKRGKSTSRGKRWVHPSHNNGAANDGSNLNAGRHSDYNGIPLPPRTTEWAFTPTDPYIDTPISVNFQEWFKTGYKVNEDAGNYGLMTGDKNGRGVGINSRVQYFAVCIEIDNPDIATRAKTPRIRGPLSEVICVWHFPDLGELNVALGHLPSGR